MSPDPKYPRIAADLAGRIVDGTYPAGRALPGESALVAEYGVARETVRRALRVLLDRGLLSVTQGVGYFPAEPGAAAHTRPDAGRPKHRVVFDTLAGRIADGTYPPGSRVPSETALMAEFDVSRVTARRALADLERAGLSTRPPRQALAAPETR